MVFESKGLALLLGSESKKYHYQHFSWGDADYDKAEGHPEKVQWESVVQNGIREFILTHDADSLNPLRDAIALLSCRYKHHGFREEAEVRIVAMPTHDEIFDLARKGGDKRERKPIHFIEREGLLVPFVKLFGGKARGKHVKLPIKKVIVGPHPDREKRRKSVELLLRNAGLKIEVSVSDIPYLGR